MKPETKVTNEYMTRRSSGRVKPAIVDAPRSPQIEHNSPVREESESSPDEPIVARRKSDARVSFEERMSASSPCVVLHPDDVQVSRRRRRDSSDESDSDESVRKHPKKDNENTTLTPRATTDSRVARIDFKIEGGELGILGDRVAAERIVKKFKIMSKLACLAGCGLDCHFRLVEDRFRLLMLVRGAPRAVLGSVITVTPDLKDLQKQMAPADFLEFGQSEFFDSILNLLPSRLRNGKSALVSDFTKGNESSLIRDLYHFLKSIRCSVLQSIAELPISWIAFDWSRDTGCADMNEIKSMLQSVGDRQLAKLEQGSPGYSDLLCKRWKLQTADQTFNQLMDHKFNSI